MKVIYKKIGKTPLQCLKENFSTKEKKYRYIGRLDPLASGLMVVLEGDECRDVVLVNKYLNSDKEYKYSFFVGASTDTFDALGLITSGEEVNFYQNTDASSKQKLKQIMDETVNSLRGQIVIPYPPYSSKTIQGIPLFVYARLGKIKDIILPKKKIHIKEHRILKTYSLSKEKLKEIILNNISSVEGDFRQEKIKSGWINFFNKTKINTFEVFELKISATSGTYVRRLVDLISKKINIPLTTLSIERTKIDKFSKETDIFKENQ